MRARFILSASLLAATALSAPALAGPELLAVGTLSQATDLSGLTFSLENGNPQNILGGLGSALAYAGGNTFLSAPDRGPNALPYNTNVDNTTSYIERFETVQMALTPNSGSSSLPFTLTPTVTGTTLLYSGTPLNYGGNPGGTQINGTAMPAGNFVNDGSGKYYFTGRSDNFGTTYGTGTGSRNQQNARLDVEGMRVSPDGQNVFVSDEYGPYVYEFNRATGERIKTFTLPGYSDPSVAGNVYVNNVSPIGGNEEKGATPGNTSGRVDNKGMEGLALTPDGKTLVGIIQAPLIQDPSKLLRIVTIDVATGVTHEYGYVLTTGSGVSEIVAINDHEFLVDERDGNGLNNGNAVSSTSKEFYVIDLDGATDITNLSGTAAKNAAVSKSLGVNFVSVLAAAGFDPNLIPAKIEGLAFGDDIQVNGVTEHTLWVANDNDFEATAALSNGTVVPNPSQYFVLGVTDFDLLPEPSTLAVLLPAVTAVAAFARRRRR